MITVKVKSEKGTPGKRSVGKIRIEADLYRYCIQNADDTRFDVEQGTCNGCDLPPEIKEICDNYDGVFYACEWPM